jgi:sterol desaturase/sphingolipid hydroxylase (fatty acid hydroxylase superfamily)
MPFLVQIAIISVFEIACAGWHGSSLHHYRSAGMTRSKATDLFLTALLVLGLAEIWVTVATFGATFLAGSIANRILVERMGLPAMETGNLLIDCLIFYFVFSFFFYWNHKILHTGPFWALHRFHHSATEMSLFNAIRQHPLQQVVERLIMVWPMALLGARPGVAIIVMSLHGFQQLLTHANLPHGWGWFGRWVLQSPGAHRVHHARDRSHADRNFGCLMIWDHVFGTYAEPVKGIPVGIESDNHNRRLFILDLVKDAHDFAFESGALISKSYGIQWDKKCPTRPKGC